jgi:hypothetical protein
MSGTALDHRLVRGYLRELDAAMRGLPAAQARELREQITAHLDDALGPDAGDAEVAAILSRLGSPAALAAEAGAASGPRPSAGGGKVRWRLATVIAVPAVTAAVLGGLQVSRDAGSYLSSGRDQHLAHLNAVVVTLTRDLEDERDLSAAYVVRRGPGPVPVTLARARTATDTAAGAVRADGAAIGPGYPPGTVRDLEALLAGLNSLRAIRNGMASSVMPASQIIRIYTDGVIGPANTLSAAVGGGTGDASLRSDVTALAAVLEAENQQSVQRAVLYAALSARPPVLRRWDLTALQQARDLEEADLADFNAATNTTEQEFFSNTVSGSAVDTANSQEILAEQTAATSPSRPLTGDGLNAATWYRGMSTTIGDMRRVTGQLTGQITARADTLKSNATGSLLLSSIVTLLLLVLLISSARPGYRSAGSRRKASKRRLSGVTARK